MSIFKINKFSSYPKYEINYVLLGIIVLAAAYIIFLAISFHEPYHYNNDDWFYRNIAYLFKHTHIFNPLYPEHGSRFDIIASNHLFLPRYLISQGEGISAPIVLWVYEWMLGDLFSPSPAAYAFPNVLFMFMGLYYACKLGCLVKDKNTGYFMALCFLSMPWLCHSLRVPWLFNVASASLAFAAWYYFLLMVRLKTQHWRIGLPYALFITLYISFSPDFLIPLFMMVLYIIITNNFRSFMSNRWNILPLMLFLSLIGCVIYGYIVKGSPGTILGNTIRKILTVISLSTDVADINREYSLSSIINFLLINVGGQLILSLLAVGFLIKKKIMATAEIQIFCLYLILLVVVFIFGNPPLKPTFSYIFTLPVTVLGGIFLSSLKRSSVIAVAIILISHQVGYFNWLMDSDHMSFGRITSKPDQRLLAVSNYLLKNQLDIEAKANVIEKTKHYHWSSIYHFEPEDVDVKNSIFLYGDNYTALRLSDLIRMPITNYDEKKLEWRPFTYQDYTLPITNTELKEFPYTKIRYVIRYDTEINKIPGILSDFIENKEITKRIRFKDQYGREILLGIIDPDVIASDEFENLNVEELSKEYYETYYKNSYFSKRIPRWQYY